MNQTQFIQTLRPALVLFLLLTGLTGLLYPAAVTGIAQALFPFQANGSLIVRDGTLVGSALIGQSFASPKYFWGRLSATNPMPYNGAASSGSNLSALNPALLDAAKARIDALRAAGSGDGAIPVDLATASGSGLDPQISLAAAQFQVARVAKVRGVPEEKVHALLAANTQMPELGFLGEARVNVLQLNLALDGAR